MANTADLQAAVAASNASAEHTDLQKAFGIIARKQQRLANLWGYYDGDQPLAYSSRRLRDIFKNLTANFSENWCAVVVDSLKDRVNLTSLSHENEQIATTLKGLWDTSELDLGSDDIHEAALVTGEGCLIVWPDEANVPQAHFNDPRLIHIQYSAENPRLMSWAAKRWPGEDGKFYLTLYYPDHLEYYVSTKKAADVQSAADLVEASPPALNPYGEIPVFHFRPQRRVIKGELTNVIPLQDAVNKLLADMMVTAEYGAAPQRYVISQMDSGTIDTPLKNAPNEIWNLPGSDGEGQPTSVGQFTAADLQNYLAAIDNLAGAIATISRTPRHYFMGDAGAALSGEALIALESPLNKKAQDRIDAFSPTWQRAAAFMLRLAGTAVLPSEIVPVYYKPETIQPRTAAEIVQMQVAAGMPLHSALRLGGMTAAELAQMAEEQEKDREAQQASLGQALMAAQARFDQGPEMMVGGTPGGDREAGR